MTTPEKALNLLEREPGAKVETIVENIFKNRKTPSEKYRKKASQTFDRTKVFKIDSAGKHNIYDETQEYLRGTEIYSVLEDYNCTTDEAMQRMYANLPEIQAELNMTAGNSYSDQLRRINEAKEMFNNLPLKVRQKFNNNIEDFMMNGHTYINDLIQEQIKETEKTEMSFNNNEENLNA